MTNWDLFEILNFTLRKNGRSEPITPERFLLLLKQENLSYFKQLVPLYSQDQKVADSLSPFEVLEDVADLTVTTTTITLPTDYAHFVGMYYVKDGNTRAYDLVTDEQWDMRCGSTITIPSDEYPICKIVGNKAYVLPTSLLTNAKFIYLKVPNTPTFAYTNDGNGNLTYGTNTELEWKDADKLKILARILRTIGVRVNEKQLFELGQQQKLEA